MIINKTDIGKFSWAEANSDANGKTSGSKFNAGIVIQTCCVCLLITVIRNTSETLTLAGILGGLITAAFAIMGYSKNKDKNDTTNTIMKKEDDDDATPRTGGGTGGGTKPDQ